MTLKSASIGILTVLLTFAVGRAQATPIVANGDFSQTTKGVGQLGYSTALTDWTLVASDGGIGYNFVFTPGSADTAKIFAQYGTFNLWGPGNGVANGLTASSPAGGNFVGLAGGIFTPAAITQSLTGLVSGLAYHVSFYWADAQAVGHYGATSDAMVVGFGDQSFTTNRVDNASQGFTPWIYQTINFVADSSSAVLSFTDAGLPRGIPPFALLADVSVTVPEPASGAIVLTGLIVLGAFAWSRKKAISAPRA